MNLPNKITVFRMVLVPFFLLLVAIDAITFNITIATVIFIIASITDHIDGHLARKYNLVTDFGKLMDPLADKILVTSALIALVEFGEVSTWMVVVIIAREFAVSGLRSIAAGDGKVIAASFWGKVKTTTQMIAIIAFFIKLIGEREEYMMRLFEAVPFLDGFFRIVPMAAMYLAVFFTLMSGVDYFVKGWKYIDSNK
ncbi:CDP-diacylglycerol--glycerol-3-phosphate 3-phosphatidyltransferase [Youngiibacter multivorans]|uniref:CDP-diacylglycerol--glycerol-3-phosphate 3-phosphatidyltransferase n=1 Tax=Youngiibacter multivorans TaxID=937251 RepID=A0ABS4G1R7_9CLOT|nr:CDP-diacylglycerol--glycerol-3-phosphate 3-phosphatidyltransferase [Youngiibacter multivorans]MBP1918490.1 CDP-diacylglycerol--glycerol-3-phosphate 3-phosphatidyltransferase [Youngiibacter multivorans]